MRWWWLSLGLLIAAAPAVRADDLGGNGRGRLAAGVIEIWKGRREMELRDGDQVVRPFKVVLGTAPREAKQLQRYKRPPGRPGRAARRRPAGTSSRSQGNRRSRFRRFIGRSYPNAEDAGRGYNTQLID